MTFYQELQLNQAGLLLKLFTEIVNFYVLGCLMQLQFVQSIRMVINAYFVGVDFVDD